MKDVPKFVRQRLAAPAGGDHPEANLLAALAEGGLTGREREQVLSHLGTCAACRETLAVAMPEIGAGSPNVAAVPSGARWLRWPMLRWAGVGAAVVVVAAAVVIQSSRRPAEVPKISVVAPAERPEQAKEPAKPAAVNEATPVLADRELRKEAAISRDFRAKAERRTDTKLESKKDAVAGQFANAVPASGPAKAAANQVADSNAPEQSQAAKELYAAAQPAGVRQRGSALAGAGVAGAVVKEQQQQAIPSAPPPPSASAAVEVAAESSVVQMQKAKSQDQVQSDLDGMKAHGGPAAKGRATTGADSASVTGGAAPKSSGLAAMTQASTMRAVLAIAPRWRLSSEGALERSTDAGRTWQSVRVAAPPPALRSFSAVDHDIWAGGAGGALYHSADNGRTWARVTVKAGAVVLDADIVRVEFTDAQHGAVTTVSGETWTTSDAGLNWSVRR